MGASEWVVGYEGGVLCEGECCHCVVLCLRLLTEHVHKQDTAGSADQGALPPGPQLTHSPPCLTNLHQFFPPTHQPLMY